MRHGVGPPGYVVRRPLGPHPARRAGAAGAGEGLDHATRRDVQHVERTSERELVVTRTFDGPAHSVFEAWTRPELLKRWWTPKSFGISFFSREADVRTGTYRFVFSHPAAEEPMAFFGRYLEVVPDSRIIWTNDESADGPVSTVTYPSGKALDEAMASDSTGTGAAGEQFEALDELLVAIVSP